MERGEKRPMTIFFSDVAGFSKIMQVSRREGLLKKAVAFAIMVLPYIHNSACARPFCPSRLNGFFLCLLGYGITQKIAVRFNAVDFRECHG